MAYEDLVEFDETVELKELPFDEVNFLIRDGDVVANFAGKEAHVTNSMEIFGNVFGIPYKFGQELAQINKNTLSNVLTDLARNQGPKDYLWGIGEDTLLTCGPSNKPHIPFSMVGNTLVNKGFELKGDLGRFGNGVITAIHPSEARVEPRVDDVISSGVRVQMSPLMIENPIVTPWSERLICTNGLTLMDDRERVNVIGRDVDTVIQQIDDLADRVFRQAEGMNYSFADMTSHRVDVFRAIRNMANAHRIPRALVEEMNERAGNLGPNEQTMFDAINIFTEVTRDIPDVNRRGNMQGVAGQILAEEEMRCQSCGHHLD